IAANNAYPAIGDLDVKAGIADSAAGCRRRPFAGINPAANYSSLGCAALHIMPDQLAAKHTPGDGEARRLIAIHAVREAADVGVAVVLECRIRDRDGFGAVIALQDAGLIIMKQAVLDDQGCRRVLGVLIANAGAVTAKRVGNARAREDEPA